MQNLAWKTTLAWIRKALTQHTSFAVQYSDKWRAASERREVSALTLTSVSKGIISRRLQITQLIDLPSTAFTLYVKTYSPIEDCDNA